MMESPLITLFPRLPSYVGSRNDHQEARIEAEKMQQVIAQRAGFWVG